MEVKKYEKSKIIVNLLNNKIEINTAFDILYVLLKDLKNEEIQCWLDKERNGYKNSDNVPEYRIVRTTIKGNYRIYDGFGYYRYKDIQLPLPKKDMIDSVKYEIKFPVKNIIAYSREEEKSGGRICSELNTAYYNQLIGSKSKNIIIESAYRSFSLSLFNIILDNIKSKLIENFTLLEQEYGNLDDYTAYFRYAV